MTSMREKRALFGGALRCAGLVAVAGIVTPAVAEFVPGALPPDPNFTSIFAFDDAYNEIVFDSSENFAGGFPSPISYTGLGGTLTAAAGPTYMGCSIDVGDPSVWGDAGVTVVQVFTVDAAKSAVLEWDLTTSAFPSLAYVLSFDSGILASHGPGTAGSMTLNLLPGETYGFIGRVGSGAGPADVSDGYVRLTWVPAPGAFALLGLGMAGTRRRRRQ